MAKAPAARPSRAAAETAGEAAPAQARKTAPGTVTVVYRPIEYETGTDPATVKWNGILFRANVPVVLNPDDPAHNIVQLMPRQFPGSNGEVLTKHVETKVFMGDLARENPSFEVDGRRARRKVSTRKVPAAGAEWTEAHEGQISYADQIDVEATRAFMAS